MHIVFQFMLFIWVLSVSYSIFTEWLFGLSYRKSIKKIKSKIDEG